MEFFKIGGNKIITSTLFGKSGTTNQIISGLKKAKLKFKKDRGNIAIVDGNEIKIDENKLKVFYVYLFHNYGKDITFSIGGYFEFNGVYIENDLKKIIDTFGVESNKATKKGQTIAEFYLDVQSENPITSTMFDVLENIENLKITEGLLPTFSEFLNEKKETKENKEFQSTSYIWNKIVPSKKYDKFSFDEVDKFEDVNAGHCYKDAILMIDGSFYLFKKEIKSTSSSKQKSKIVFMDGKKVIKEIEA